MEPPSSPCRHNDVQVFDGLRCCLSCGEAIFETTSVLSLSPQHEGVTAYTYSPLNYVFGQEIRLVKLFPGYTGDDVALDIIHVNLKDSPAYEAMSYAWATQDGDDSLSQAVYCHGRKITVTKHCEAALRCLRWKGRSRCLWVDAISIDQGNVLERNHQVGFMGSIYANASQVLIYLGPGTEGTDKMLDYLNGDTTALGRTDRCTLNRLVIEFLNQRWLDRVWVLQEIALAKMAIMIAGKKTTPWTLVSIEKVVAMCNNLRIKRPSALHWLPASEPEADILPVLHKSRNCSSSDPRDKVFAVLGLAHSDYQEAFPVDYSLSPEETFTKLAVHLIRDWGNLTVLKYVTGQNTTLCVDEEGLPSWAPRWDMKITHDPLPAQFDVSQLENLRSTFFSSASLLVTKRDSKLRKSLQRIPESKKCMSTNSWYHWLSLWLMVEGRFKQAQTSAWVQEMALSLSHDHTKDFHFAISERDMKLHCKTLSEWNKVLDSSPSSKWPCLRIRAHRIDTVNKVIGSRSLDQLKFLPQTLPHALSSFRLCTYCTAHFVQKPICQQNPSVERAMLDEFSGVMKQQPGEERVLFQSIDSMGFSQATPISGDHVWVLDGLDVPLVLRRVEFGVYVVVGECYLYRALRHHPCMCCGCEVEPWSIKTEIIDIW